MNRRDFGQSPVAATSAAIGRTGAPALGLLPVSPLARAAAAPSTGRIALRLPAGTLHIVDLTHG